MVDNLTSTQSAVKIESTVDRGTLDEDWEMAQERILLYLRCMNISPGEERLMLALESLRRTSEGKSNDPITPAAVGIARGLVKEYYRNCKDTTRKGVLGKKMCEGQLRKFWSMPPLNRRIMIPVNFDQVPEWLTTESFLQRIILQLRPLILPIFLFLNLLLLLGFFWIRKLQ